MAKILYSTIGFGVKELYCYHDQFTNALKKHGNEVLVMTSNKIIKNGWSSNDHFSYVDEKKLDEFIKSFNPDLVIASNNVLYNRVPKIIDCPIVIFAADKPIGYADSDKIKKNVDRYHFIYETIDWEKQIYELFNPKPSRMIMMPTATDIQAESLEQDVNISFIGSNFNYTHNFKNYFYDKSVNKDLNKFKQFYDVYRSDLSQNIDDILKKLNFDKSILGKISEMDLLNLMSGNKRVQTLAAISDLGLSLYGTDNWIDVLDYSFDLALCYEKNKIITAKQNQDLYNRSKIAINLSHEQALDNFSWRVRDIMASNACLVSDYRKNLEVYFGKYVKIPTFNNPFEARDLCQKLLKDESWRSDIVKECQLAIEEKHRFSYRLRDMEQALGVKLFNNDKNGSIEFLNPDNFITKPSCTKTLLSDNGPLRVANRVRVNLIRTIKKKSKLKIKKEKMINN
jgi:hypothetical protein